MPPGEYATELNMRYELEWEYDQFIISSHSHNQDIIIDSLTGHEYIWSHKMLPFYLSESSGLKLSFTSDESLDYRGVEIEHNVILKKPEGQCDPGDLNQNILIDIVDIIMMVNFIMDENATGFQMCLSDMDLNGTIDVSDIILLINIILERN